MNNIPWKHRRNDDYVNGGTEIVDSKGESVCWVAESSVNFEANKVLILAAPGLLEKAKAILGITANHENYKDLEALVDSLEVKKIQICPNCGYKSPKIHNWMDLDSDERENHVGSSVRYQVQCYQCYLYGPAGKTEQEAVEAWNKITVGKSNE